MRSSSPENVILARRCVLSKSFLFFFSLFLFTVCQQQQNNVIVAKEVRVGGSFFPLTVLHSFPRFLGVVSFVLFCRPGFNEK